VRTYTHGIIGYLLYARGSADARKLAAIGAILPDGILAVGYVFHLAYVLPDAPALGALHLFLHSTLHPITEAMHSLLLVVPAAVVLWALGRGELPLLVGMASHGVVDLLTHVDAAYNHLFPLPLEPITAPVSYTSPRFTLVEHGLVALFAAWYLLKRKRSPLAPAPAGSESG